MQNETGIQNYNKLLESQQRNYSIKFDPNISSIFVFILARRIVILLMSGFSRLTKKFLYVYHR